MRQNLWKERPSGYVTIKDLGVYETSILCVCTNGCQSDYGVCYLNMGQDQFDLTPEMEIAKRVEEIGADLDELWSFYQ